MGATYGLYLARDVVQEILRRSHVTLFLERGIESFLEEELNLNLPKKVSLEKFLQGYFGSSRLKLPDPGSFSLKNEGAEKILILPGRLQHLAWMRYRTGEDFFSGILGEIMRMDIPKTFYLLETDFDEEDLKNLAYLQGHGILLKILPSPYHLTRKIQKETHQVFLKRIMNEVLPH